MRIVVGIDVGGTSIKGAAVMENGVILDRFAFPTNKNEKPEVLVGKICDAIKTQMSAKHYEVVGIGIGIPGLINSKDGIVTSSANLPTWKNFEIAKFVEESTGKKTYITNDANAAALGEAHFGAGKKYNDLVMVTLGTGVGGGVIIDKKIFDGNEGKGAELGHMVVQVGGRDCGCGRRGCLEAYASATGLIASTIEAMENHPESKLHEVAKENGKVDARVAFLAEAKGDKIAKEVVDNYVMYLGEGLLNFCNIFRPEALILSGGVANEGDNLFSRIKKYLKDHDYGYKDAPKVDVLPSELGYDSGIIGAACLPLFKE